MRGKSGNGKRGVKPTLRRLLNFPYNYLYIPKFSKVEFLFSLF